MRTTAYRVREVLLGFSSTAAVVAVDAEGREVRLEVGALEGRSIQVDEVLVLSWATVQVPKPLGAAAPSGGEEEEALHGRSLDEVVDPATDQDDSAAATQAIDAELDEIKALIGLQ